MTKLPMKNLLVLGLASALSTGAMAQSKQVQTMCRSKAKEVAKSAFDQCLLDAKDREADLIREDYRRKISKLKELYEQKLRKLSLKAKASPKGEAPNTMTTPAAETFNALPAKVERPTEPQSAYPSQQPLEKSTVRAQGQTQLQPPIPPPAQSLPQQTMQTATQTSSQPSTPSTTESFSQPVQAPVERSRESWTERANNNRNTSVEPETLPPTQPREVVEPETARPAETAPTESYNNTNTTTPISEPVIRMKQAPTTYDQQPYERQPYERQPYERQQQRDKGLETPPAELSI